MKREVPVHYKDIRLNLGFRLDLLIENKVIIEVKSVGNLAEVRYKQVSTYLKITELRLGFLINFNVVNIKDGIYRKVNGL